MFGLTSLATFPWTSIIMFLLSFFFQKAQGRSTAAALLTGAAVGAGTYFLADPANPDNLLGFGQGDVPLPETTGDTSTTTTGGSIIEGVASQVIDTTGEVLTSWGPTGTAMVIGAGALASSKSIWPWLLLGGIALVVIK